MGEENKRIKKKIKKIDWRLGPFALMLLLCLLIEATWNTICRMAKELRHPTDSPMFGFHNKQ